MQALSRRNKWTLYILTLIDVLSKYAWAIPVKIRGGPEMKNALEILFQMSNPRKPDKLQTDAGKEFLNKEAQDFSSPMGSSTLFRTVTRKQQQSEDLTGH